MMWWQVVCGLILLTSSTYAKIGTFWHVTDFHYDMNYTETSGDITKMCWNSSNDLGSQAKPGQFGDYECDAPLTLIESAVNAMKEIFPNPDFVMWTGDDTAHVDDGNFSTKKVVEIIEILTNVLKDNFKNTPFLPVLGNHDYYPKNQFPPGENPLQTSVADIWKDWLEKEYEAFKMNGSYYRNIPNTNVTVVALNTVIWYKSNDVTASDSNDDPGNQFKWADNLLTELAKNHSKVYLMGHIPPGTFERYQQKKEGFHWYQERFNEKFLELVQKHSNIIKAQFFAHHHTDSFRLIFDPNDSSLPVSYLLLAPGVTPWRSSLSEETGANNPGIRLIKYDTVTGELKEVSTYYLDLTEANKIGKAEWKLEYNFTSNYNLKEITPNSLYDLVKTMETNETIFNRYYNANTVSLEDPSLCTAQCRRLHWCAITEIDYDRFHQCNGASRLSSWLAGTLAGTLALLLALR